MNRIRRKLYHFVLFVIAVSLLLPATAGAGRKLMRIPVKNRAVFEQLRRPGIEILAVNKDGIIDAMVDDKQVDYVFSLGYPVSAAPIDDVMRAPAELDANLGMYHTFAEMESLITTWESDFPAICDLFTIGSSVESRPIYGIKISDNVTVDETGEAEVLFMGNHHARELMSVDIPLRFAQYLLDNYGVDPTITSYIDTREIYFVPMINPDGHVYVQNNHSGFWGNWWRKNRVVNADTSIGVDLNRNYDYEWGYDDIGSDPSPSSWTYRGPSAFSEPETQAVRDFVNSREFTMWLSYHTYGELLLYPWGFIPEHTPDHRYYKRLGELLTETNGYFAGNLLMGAIYPVNGDSDDWGYGEQATKNKIFAFTPEMNSYDQGGFGPPDTMIQPTFDLNLEMNMRVLEYCANPYGVVGPFRPAMYAIQAPYDPVHKLIWSGDVPGDPNPTQHYQVERCINPGYIADDAEIMSSTWVYDGFTQTTTAHSGSYGYYSGSGDNLNSMLTAERPVMVDAQSDTFTFWTSYDIEVDYDYAYVEVSTDQGESWTTVQGNITTTHNPYGNNRGDGITGASPGWVEGIFPLTAYLGQEIQLRIAYATDGAWIEHGIDVDDLWPVPTCETVDLIADAETDTSLVVVPDQVATYRYRVEGVDGDGDRSGWSNTKEFVVTTVTDASAPLSFNSRLDQNRPNPFNPVTSIPYVVGGAADGAGAAPQITLHVYDVSGRLMATLVDEKKAPGQYQATWSGATTGGGTATTGVYFYRLTIGGRETFTRKMLLLK
jgi:hypothetical protein